MGGNLSKKEMKRIQKVVDMTKEEIKQWHKEYRRSCQNGKQLTVHEFKKVYNMMFKGDASKFAENVFRTFDRDGNGRVDFEEFLIGLSITSSSDVEKKLKWAFNMYDIDHSGTIDKEEMREIIQAVYQMTAIAVTLPDDMATPEELADSLFVKIDTNGDGELSWEEFRDGALSDSMVVRLLQMDPGS